MLKLCAVGINIQNLNEIKELINLAENQSEQLKQTIKKINEFQLKVEASSRKPVQEQQIEEVKAENIKGCASCCPFACTSNIENSKAIGKNATGLRLKTYGEISTKELIRLVMNDLYEMPKASHIEYIYAAETIGKIGEVYVKMEEVERKSTEN